MTKDELKSIFRSYYNFNIDTAFKDKIYYTPTIENLKRDYKIAKKIIADDFNVPDNDNDLRKLYSNLEDSDITIWDCDNVVRELRSTLNKIHYKRYLKKEHSIKYEYAAFTSVVKSDELYGNGNFHIYVMVFTEEREIYFLDFPYYIWSIKDWNPDLLRVE